MSEPDETPETDTAPAVERGEPRGGADDRRTGTRGRTLAVLLGLAALVLVADQLTKIWAESALVAGGAAEPLLGELVQLRLVYNPGAALSIASGMTWVLTLLSAVVVVIILVTARRVRTMSWAVALGMVLGGAVGNLLDRLFRDPGFPTGHVVDFIDYGPFVGNVADIAIVGAAVLITVLAFVGVGPEGRTDETDEEADA
ncbi:signal peptidase II [Sanguibacter suaedae]|uniref:Lipoprotein signal peptidase n=1 Tax=Sanguibacter suaedae TaxID=2795737 RepID=A0A934ICW9_9MICO|nr:signal peptidase II [Sanguibacter suaedae]MBI9115455.1 signal peptidase II [Sanguibacter suaedae]